MSEIALYNALTKLGLELDEAERAVADVASSKEMATKADLEKLETKLIAEMKSIKWMFGLLFAMNVALLIKLFL